MKNFFLFCVLVCSSISHAQTPDWEWAQSAGGVTNDEGRKMCTDIDGNVYVTGVFKSPTITFGSYTLYEITGSAYYSDIFVVKYDPNGNVLWAAREGSALDDFPGDIKVDPNGNIYVTGWFTTDITIGSTILYNADTTCGAPDAFIVKYDPAGVVQWARSVGGLSADYGSGVAFDPGGGVYFTGRFASPIINIDSIVLHTSDYAVQFDVFIVKYDTNGYVLWAKSEGAENSEHTFTCGNDATGNLYVSGSFQSDSVQFGTTTVINLDPATYSLPDLFLVKYDPTGNVLWAKSAGGIKSERGFTNVDNTGNVYFTGDFRSATVVFTNDTLTNLDPTNFFSDIFITKYDSSGNVTWAKKAGGPIGDFGNASCSDIYGNCYVTGTYYSDYFNFETIVLSNDSIGGSYKTDDIYVAKYDSAGNVLWAKRAGKKLDDEGLAIACDNFGNAYITGFFQSPTIVFDATTLINANGGTGSNYSDYFIARLGNSPTVSIEDKTSHNKIAIYPNPFNEQTKIIFSKDYQNATLKVINLLGKEIKSILVSGNEYTLKKESCVPGIYFVEVFSENQLVACQKVIIQ